MKVGMIGGRTSTLGFGALGVDTFAVPRPEDAPEVWRLVDPSEYAVLFVTEPIYDVLREELEAVSRQPMPVITVIPAVTGGGGTGLKELKVLVERAVGTDVLLR